MTTTDMTTEPGLDEEQQEAIENCVDDWFTQDRARDYVREVVAKSGTSFGPGMAIMSRPQREAMYAIYAFCRDVDDTADDVTIGEDVRLDKLQLWRDEIDALYNDDPNWLTSLALLEPVYAFNLPKEEFLAMIDGMAMDAAETMRAPSREELALYTRRVAGSVGILSMRVFGPNDAIADKFALTLGDAFQLTNILRDVAEDGARGRVYLPREYMEQFGVPVPVTPEDVPATLHHPALGQVCAALADEAAALYRECDELAVQLDSRAIRPARVMWRVYAAYLQEMQARGWANPLATIRFSKFKKLRLAASGLFG